VAARSWPGWPIASVRPGCCRRRCWPMPGR
jgi:hypothetical protein